jgi:hypothetical protein
LKAEEEKVKAEQEREVFKAASWKANGAVEMYKRERDGVLARLQTLETSVTALQAQTKQTGVEAEKGQIQKEGLWMARLGKVFTFGVDGFKALDSFGKGLGQAEAMWGKYQRWSNGNA